MEEKQELVQITCSQCGAVTLKQNYHPDICHKCALALHAVMIGLWTENLALHPDEVILHLNDYQSLYQ